MTEREAEKERYQLYLNTPQWGQLRRQVHERAGGKCERCRNAPIDAVHHLTYERKYRERLEDLQGICDPCHEFTHGKRKHDPLFDVPAMLMGRTIKSVYLAGKISRDDWRDEILPNWSQGNHGANCSLTEDCRLICKDVDPVPLPDGREIKYHGPFWVDLAGGHGVASDNAGKHACGVPVDSLSTDHKLVYRTQASDVQQRCQASIASSDLVFAWIDSVDCYGTLVEIGMARAADKIVVVATPAFNWNLWFALASADILIDSDTPGQAWIRLWTDPGRCFATDHLAVDVKRRRRDL